MARMELVELSIANLRAVAAFSADCARPSLQIYRAWNPTDGRPEAAIKAAEDFSIGGSRSNGLRNSAFASLRAAREAQTLGYASAAEAARAAAAAAAAGFLHPLPKATQVRHILGAAAHSARAFELQDEQGPHLPGWGLDSFQRFASTELVMVLKRYPSAPPAGGRLGELIRALDASLRMLSEEDRL